MGAPAQIYPDRRSGKPDRAPDRQKVPRSLKPHPFRDGQHEFRASQLAHATPTDTPGAAGGSVSEGARRTRKSICGRSRRQSRLPRMATTRCRPPTLRCWRSQTAELADRLARVAHVLRVRPGRAQDLDDGADLQTAAAALTGAYQMALAEPAMLRGKLAKAAADLQQIHVACSSRGRPCRSERPRRSGVRRTGRRHD